MLARSLSVACVATTVLASCSSIDPQVGILRPACVDADSNPNDAVSFARDIRPLVNREKDDATGNGCKSCHYATQPTIPQSGTGAGGTDLSGLDLGTLGALRKGGNTSHANVVIPGKPCSSVLVLKLQGAYAAAPTRMPKNLETTPVYWSDSQIQIVIDWIAEGAKGADSE